MNSNVCPLKNTSFHYLLLNTTIIPQCNGKVLFDTKYFSFIVTAFVMITALVMFLVISNKNKYLVFNILCVKEK